MIDFHTHQIPQDASFTIRSLQITEAVKLIDQGFFSIGIHPWYTENIDYKAHLIDLSNHLKQINIIAVGEIGLDKLRGASLENQIDLFEKQVRIAEKSQKPVVIHCVRAWTELIESKKRLNTTIPWAIHGFRGHSELANQLVDSGFYLSLGPAVLNASEILQESVRNIPLNRLFIETDEAEVSLKNLYITVAKIKRVKFRDLEEQISFNFAEFFKSVPGC